jgi:phosphopantetheinyl transferase (holo-ACP synthase)
MPRDCPLLRNYPKGFAKRAISTKDIENYSKQIQSKHVLMFFDTSFSGKVFSLQRAVLKAISKKNPFRYVSTSLQEARTSPIWLAVILSSR